MNTVYRRKTKQPLYLESCYLVSCIYKCSCVYFWQHITVSLPACMCVCACLCLEAGFCFLHSRQTAAAAAAPSGPNAKMLQTHLRIVRALSKRITLVCSFRFWICCRTPADRISAQALRDKTGAVPHWTTLRIVELSEKVCPTNNATPHGENVLSFKCVVAPWGRLMMFYRT